MYKLYIRVNGYYKGPKIYNSYDKAKLNAEGEYIIIKRENDTDEIIEHDIIEEMER